MTDQKLTEMSLLDCVSFIVDNRGRTCPVVAQGFPLIATNSITEQSRRVVPKDLRFVDQVTYDNWFRAHPKPNDILFVCKGTPGKVALVPDPVPYCIAQDMVALRADEAKVDPVYLYYRLSAPDVRERIEGLHVGTLIPHFKKGDFDKLRFPVHGRDEQRRIASALSALDDLIETNRGLASQMAEQLTTMFGSLSAVQERSFFDVFDVDFGAAFKGEHFSEPGTGLPLLRIRDLKTLRSDVWTTERIDGDVLVMPGDVVVGMDAEFRATRWLGRPSLLNQRVCRVRAKAGSLAWTREALVAPLAFVEGHKTGTTVAHLNKRDLAELRIAVPASEGLARFDAQAEPLHRGILALQEEIDQITRTRDELLPLLMSGKVRVSEDLAVA